MKELKYKVIRSKTQYNQYCKLLENMVVMESNSKYIKDEIDLLTLLIEKWDMDHTTFRDLDPIQLLSSLMEEHHLRPIDLSNILGISRGYVSEILHYKKGLSKDIIRILASFFKVNQDAFNRPYKLKVKAKQLISV